MDQLDHMHEFRNDYACHCGEVQEIGVLYDVPDARRDQKPNKAFLPDDQRDVTHGMVELREYFGVNYPACKYHGALLCVNYAVNVWRCGDCGVGCQYRKVKIN